MVTWEERYADVCQGPTSYPLCFDSSSESTRLQFHPTSQREFLSPLLSSMSEVALVESPVKRYPEPMAHGPEACGQSHPLWPMARRPASRHTRAEAVDTGYPRSLTREIWNPISNQ